MASIETTSWLSMVPLAGSSVACPGCGCAYATTAPFLDHDISPCAGCSIPLVFLTTWRAHLVVSLDRAPEPVRRCLAWCAENLDELEFIELLVLVEGVLSGDGSAR